jgi:hypothetical protein
MKIVEQVKVEHISGPPVLGHGNGQSFETHISLDIPEFRSFFNSFNSALSGG